MSTIATKSIPVTPLPNIVFRDDGCILVKNVRASYLHVFKAWAMNADEKPKFSGRFLLSKVTHKGEIQALGQHLMKMCQDNFKARIASDKLCMRDGDGSGKPEQEGSWVISASEDKKPNTINRDKSDVTDEMDIIYSGCYVNLLMRPWAQNNSFGKRINANLLAVQYVRDGERFSGVSRPDVSEVFDDVSEEFGGADDISGADDIPF